MVGDRELLNYTSKEVFPLYYLKFTSLDAENLAKYKVKLGKILLWDARCGSIKCVWSAVITFGRSRWVGVCVCVCGVWCVCMWCVCGVCVVCVYLCVCVCGVCMCVCVWCVWCVCVWCVCVWCVCMCVCVWCMCVVCVCVVCVCVWCVCVCVYVCVCDVCVCGVCVWCVWHWRIMGTNSLLNCFLNNGRRERRKCFI